jgi:putative restriction endonuclease
VSQPSAPDPSLGGACATATADFLRRVSQINTWQRGGERAPHKPLLLLLALGRLSRGEKGLPWSICEKELSALLREFGPPRRNVTPEQPFVRLAKDSLWELGGGGGYVSQTDNPLVSVLKDRDPIGWFLAADHALLTSSPDLAVEAARRLLEAHFPESLHQDILNAVGLSLDRVIVSRKARDPRFRERILTAYEFRCAVCSLDIRLGRDVFGLEAAHIQWHQAGGPDTEANGLALCTMHHKLFDYGAFTLHDERRVLVSERAYGGEQFERMLMRHHGQPLARPVRPDFAPGPAFIDWHRRQVFKPEARHWDGEGSPITAA